MYENIYAFSGTPTNSSLLSRLETWKSAELLNHRDESDTYITALERFSNITRAGVLIVLEEKPGLRTVNEIFYAMLAQKPILVLSPNMRIAQPLGAGIINSRLNKMFVGNFEVLEDDELRLLLDSMRSTKKINYVLTRHETILMRAQLRAYFRAL
jgi:hypothetical protein